MDDQVMERSYNLIKQREEKHLIDPIDNIKNSAVYIISGIDDLYTPPLLQAKQENLYKKYGVENIKYFFGDRAHSIEYEDAYNISSYLYSHIPGTGVSEETPLK